MPPQPADRSAPPPGESSHRPDVSVISPVYRNRDTILELCKRVSGAFSATATTWELILVIDSCPDRSEELLQEISKRYPSVRGVYLPENQGQNRAVLWGLTRSRGRRIAVLDADLQDPPEALPEMLATLDQTGAQLMFARRTGQWTSAGRSCTSRLFKAILWGASGGRIPVDAGLFLVGDRCIAKFLLDTPFVAPYLMSRLARYRGRVASVSVTRNKRALGTSAYNSGMRLRLALRGLLQLTNLPFEADLRRPQPWRGQVIPIDQSPPDAEGSAGNVDPSPASSGRALFQIWS